MHTMDTYLSINLCLNISLHVSEKVNHGITHGNLFKASQYVHFMHAETQPPLQNLYLIESLFYHFISPSTYISHLLLFSFTFLLLRLLQARPTITAISLEQVVFISNLFEDVISLMPARIPCLTIECTHGPYTCIISILYIKVNRF